MPRPVDSRKLAAEILDVLPLAAPESLYEELIAAIAVLIEGAVNVGLSEASLAELQQLRAKGQRLCEWIGPLLISLNVSTPEDACVAVDALRAEVARLRDGIAFIIQIIGHLRWCQTCAEDGDSACFNYGTLVDDLIAKHPEIAREMGVCE